MVMFVKCRRSESKCFFRSYVFADCKHEAQRGRKERQKAEDENKCHGVVHRGGSERKLGFWVDLI